MASIRRRLMRHGFVFLFIALLLGLATATLPHAEKWLAAHVTSLMTGVVLIVIGLAWGELHLTAGQARVGYLCGVTGAYAGLAGGVYSALVNLPGPASNPGVAAPMPQAAVFFAILAIVIPTIVISFGLALYGMRGESPR